MIGKSYGAVVQWQVAVQRPPALKAIVVRSANDDVYTGFTNPGGCIRPWMFEYYAPLMNALNFAPPDPALVGDRWAAIWAERLERSAPWSLGYIRNTLHGPYWRDQSLAPGYDRVQCAVLLIEGWADWYATEELRAFQRLSAPKKVLIGPWGHYYAEEREAFPGPRIDARREYLEWFDHWLKGIDNGVMDEPPVTVFVRGWQAPSLLCLEDAGTWRNEAAWPPARVQPTTDVPVGRWRAWRMSPAIPARTAMRTGHRSGSPPAAVAWVRPRRGRCRSISGWTRHFRCCSPPSSCALRWSCLANRWCCCTCHPPRRSPTFM